MPIMDATLSKESSPPLIAGRMSKTAAYYLAFVALGLASASLGPTLPGLAENTQTQLREISFLFTGRSLGYLLGSFFGGRLYDRKPGHPVMGLMLIGMAMALTLTPTVSLLWLLTGLLLLLGIAEGAVDVGGNTLLVWVHRHQVGPFMNGLHFFFGIGAFLSPLIIAQAVLVSGDIAWAYWILALLILPVALWLLRLPSPPAQTITKDGPVGQVNHRLVALIVLFFFLAVSAEVSFGGWIFTYTRQLNLANETVAAYLTSAFWGALTVGRLLAIPIAVHVRPRYILLGDLLGCLVSVGLILIWPSSILATWLATLGIGLSMASIFPTTLSLAERRMTITGQVTGWFFVGASAGGMFLPWLIGQLFESVGPQMLPLVLIIDLTLALGLLLILSSYSAQAVVKAEGQ
jgi:MFS transporter, FHS family, Na+ dependent glucose transporter 1